MHVNAGIDRRTMQMYIVYMQHFMKEVRVSAIFRDYL